MDAFVPIAEVVKAVGLRGEVKLYRLIDFYDPLLASDYLVWARGGRVSVAGQRDVKSGTVIQIAGVDDRNAAEALVGRTLGFRRESYAQPDFPRPPQGLPFRYLDREVHTVAGEVIGTVAEVRLYGAQTLLVLLRQGREVLIPAVAPILRESQALAGPLVIDPPEGLIDGP